MKYQQIGPHHYRTQIDALSAYKTGDTFRTVDGNVSWNHGTIVSVWTPFSHKVISGNKLTTTFYQDLEMAPDKPISFSRIMTGIYD